MRTAFQALLLLVVCNCSQKVVPDPGREPIVTPALGGHGGGSVAGKGGAISTGSSISLPDATAIGLPGAGTDPAICGNLEFNLDRSLVDVLLVLDVSGSLSHAVSTGGTGYSNLYKAVRTVVEATQKNLDWGVKPFPVDKFCYVSPTIEVPVGSENYPAVDDLLTKHTPAKGDGTPTGTAIDEGVKYLKSLKSSKPQYMVLATDGEPNCSVRGSASSVAGHVQTVKDAYQQGVATYVIGIAESVRSSTTLNQMAIEGGRPRKVDALVDPLFYAAQNEAEVVAAMKEIVNQLISCVFALEAPPSSINDVAVDVYKRGTTDKGQRVPRDKTHADGWDYVDSSNRAIELFGSWCDKVRDVGIDGNDVRFIFGCPGIRIP